MPETITKRRQNLYVDDLLAGGVTVQEAQNHKDQAI